MAHSWRGGGSCPGIILTSSDEEIARAIRESLRFGVDICARGLSETTRKDARNLIWEILNDDHKSLMLITDLKKRKNWLFITPTV